MHVIDHSLIRQTFELGRASTTGKSIVNVVKLLNLVENIAQCNKCGKVCQFCILLYYAQKVLEVRLFVATY